MSRERVLQRRIQALVTLEEAVGALRSLSAQHFRAARAPLAAARIYRDELQGFLGVLETADAAPFRDMPTGIVVVAADLGLVGEYTTRLVREALELRAESGPGPVICLGRRAVSPLAKAGVQPVLVLSAPTAVNALTGLLVPLVDSLLSLRQGGELGALWIVAARFEGAGAYSPVRVPLLPVSGLPAMQWTASSPYCEFAHLRNVVVREYLYASLYETLLESLASEHGKRLLVAESAHTWLDERISVTRRLARAIRREASTQEVLEVVVAARAARRDAQSTS